jgi:hypothetical protein
MDTGTSGAGLPDSLVAVQSLVQRLHLHVRRLLATSPALSAFIRDTSSWSDTGGIWQPSARETRRLISFIDLQGIGLTMVPLAITIVASQQECLYGAVRFGASRTRHL